MASNLKVIITNPQTVIKIPSGTRMLVRRSCHATLEYEQYDRRIDVIVPIIDAQDLGMAAVVLAAAEPGACLRDDLRASLVFGHGAHLFFEPARPASAPRAGATVVKPAVAPLPLPPG